MSQNFSTIVKLEVPLVVRLGERVMRVSEVLALMPGSIIELEKGAEEPLDLMANDRVIGSGYAMKVGENFGIRITCVGDAAERMEALLASDASADPGPASVESLASQMAGLS